MYKTTTDSPLLQASQNQCGGVNDVPQMARRPSLRDSLIEREKHLFKELTRVKEAIELLKGDFITQSTLELLRDSNLLY